MSLVYDLCLSLNRLSSTLEQFQDEAQRSSGKDDRAFVIACKPIRKDVSLSITSVRAALSLLYTVTNTLQPWLARGEYRTFSSKVCDFQADLTL